MQNSNIDATTLIQELMSLSDDQIAQQSPQHQRTIHNLRQMILQSPQQTNMNMPQPQPRSNTNTTHIAHNSLISTFPAQMPSPFPSQMPSPNRSQISNDNASIISNSGSNISFNAFTDNSDHNININHRPHKRQKK
eukprot:150135_1